MEGPRRGARGEPQLRGGRAGHGVRSDRAGVRDRGRDGRHPAGDLGGGAERARRDGGRRERDPGDPGEEEKIGPELNKVLGTGIEVSVAVNRVPVLDGHTAHVFLKLGSRASPGDVARVLEDFRPPAVVRALPTLPERPLVLRTEPDRPQPRLDADAAAGMAVSIGRIRAAPPPHDIAFVVVAHNGIRGAAGACLANAELYMTRYGAPHPAPALAKL